MQFLVLTVKWQCRVNGVRLSSMLNETNKQTEQESTKQSHDKTKQGTPLSIVPL